MKKIIALICVMIAAPAIADDYTAKLNEDGKYCAKVEVQGIAGLTRKKTFCRTLEEWERAGYSIAAKEKDAS